MGNWIAQVFAQQEHAVRLIDVGGRPEQGHGDHPGQPRSRW